MVMAHLRVIVSEAHLAEYFPGLLTESRWVNSGISDLCMRVDPERPEMRQKRHVHIAHKKHVNANNRQVSWNNDGSRHDRGRFDDGFAGMKQAQAVARIALCLSDDQLLESQQTSRFDLLIEQTREAVESDETLPAVDFYLTLS